MKLAAVEAFTHQCALPPIDMITGDVVIVGGFVERETDILIQDDERYYRFVRRNMAEQDGIVFSDDANVHACNMCYADNFLKDAISAEAVVFSKIYFDPCFSDRGQIIDRRFYKQCMSTGQKGVWANALARTGARYAVNVTKQGDEYSLPTDRVLPASFRLVRSVTHGGMIYDFMVRDDARDHSPNMSTGTCRFTPMSSNP